jgi:geranylgeranyl pyrophosphate synthase
LNFSYFHIIDDISIVYSNFAQLISFFQPNVNTQKMSHPDLFQFTKDTRIELELNLNSVYFFIFHEQSKEYDWLNSIKSISREFNLIKKTTDKYNNLQEKSLQQSISYLIQRAHDLKQQLSQRTKKQSKNVRSSLEKISRETIKNLSSQSLVEIQNEMLADQLFHSFNEF